MQLFIDSHIRTRRLMDTRPWQRIDSEYDAGCGGLLICQGESGRWFLGKDVGVENENRILYADFLTVEELGFYDRRDWVLEAAKNYRKEHPLT